MIARIRTFLSTNAYCVRARAFVSAHLFWVVLAIIVVIAVGSLIFTLSGSPEKTKTGIANLLFLKLAFAGLIFGTVKSKENTKISAGLVGAAIFVLLIIMGKFETFFSGSSSNINNIIWVAIIAGLIWAAVKSQEKPYLAWTFAGLAVLIFLVLLGKVDALFGWAILGLPIFAAIGFYGAHKATGGAKAFLGFASSIVVLFWMHMFYQDGHQIKGIGFFDETIPMLFPDATAKTIFIVFAGLTGLALWKKSKFFGILAIVAFLSFGSTLVDKIIERFPEKLTPSTEKVTAVKSVVNGVIEKITAPSVVQPPPLTSAQSNAPGWEEVVSRFIDLSQIEPVVLGQNQCVVKIQLPLDVLTPGNHRIKISGEYQFLLGDHSWKSFTWQGNDRLSGIPSNKPYADSQYGAIILLNNGENITPAKDEGTIVYLNATSDFSVRVNAFTRNPAEWYSPKFGRMILRNSPDKPLKITIEKEVKS